MIIDLRNDPPRQNVETDVCIVGAGAAGITLAREMSGEPFRVCLLESGGMRMDRRTQSLYRGENVGTPYFPMHWSRFRYFGGSTNRWTGWCRPLDPIDFEARDWIPHSGWPINASTLQPYYDAAQSICQLQPRSYQVEEWEDAWSARLPLSDERLVTRIFQFSPPTVFGAQYGDEIRQAENISCILGANAVNLEADASVKKITKLNAVTLERRELTVTAKLYILAAGGIENARLLLLSRGQRKEGLGNQNDLVGRFFMEHPYLGSGYFLPSKGHDSLNLYLAHCPSTGTVVGERIGALTLSEDILRAERLVNCGVYFIPRPKHKTLPGYASPGMVSLHRIFEALQRFEFPEDPGRNLKAMSTGIGDIGKSLMRQVTHALRPESGLGIRAFVEPAPNRDSRLVLSDHRDRLGQERVSLDWKLSEVDHRSLVRMNEILAEEIQRAGLGKIETAINRSRSGWPANLTGGNHHMGTTRMHEDPRLGVVDADCRVHGISNLFAAGSSVFPTAGYANPTLTIVALAARLADHLKKTMGHGFDLP